MSKLMSEVQTSSQVFFVVETQLDLFQHFRLKHV